MFEGFVIHGFLVDNVENATEKYTKNFGFKLLRAEEDFAELDLDSDFGLFFWKYDHIARHIGYEKMEPVKHKLLSAMVYDTRAEVDAAYEHLKSRNVRFIAEPQVWDWNAYAAYFVDDNGFMWELWTWN